MNEKLTVRQVVDQAVEAMLAMGQSPNTVWRAFYPRCTRLIRFYEQHQVEFYDPELTRAYTTMLYAKFHAGELSRQNYLNYLKTAESNGPANPGTNENHCRQILSIGTRNT